MLRLFQSDIMSILDADWTCGISNSRNVSTSVAFKILVIFSLFGISAYF